MPTYVYKCRAYGITDCAQAETWEVFKSIKLADEPELCPHCKREGVKVLHASPVHFKGGGWYHSTYGAKNPGNK